MSNASSSSLWMPGCFVGLALPSMLSLIFLPEGKIPTDKWQVAGMTAAGVRDAMTKAHSASIGNFFWYLTLFIGFMILSTAMASTADGVLRRLGRRLLDCKSQAPKMGRQ